MIHRLILATCLTAGSAMPVRAASDYIQTTAGTTDSAAILIEQVNVVARQLIAPCCWNQTLDAHHSEIAKTMKSEILDALRQGKTHDEIIEGYVARYGVKILAVPKPSGFNLSLWVLPVLLLVAGGLALVVFLRRFRAGQRRESAKPGPVDDETARKIEAELEHMEQ